MGVFIKLIILISFFLSSNLLSKELSKADVKRIVKEIEHTQNNVRNLNKDKKPCAVKVEAKKPITELTKKREVSSFTSTCLKSINKKLPTNFKDTIKLAVDLNSEPSKNSLSSYISGVYNISKWNTDVGLYSHPMCESFDKKLVARNSSKKVMRASQISGALSSLPKHFNKIRGLYLKAKADKNKELELKYKDALDNFYTTLLGTLANHESLSTADNSSSRGHAGSFAAKYGVKNYKKPPGVKLYLDKLQTKDDSKRNVGLYQLPMSGNVEACVKAWNERVGNQNKSCVISKKSKKDMFVLNSASDQLFNAFCGANKLVQSFGVQVNSNVFETGSARRTHQDNYNSKTKKLKDTKNRCVSLFTHTSNTYNHFGTLGFTTHNNTVDVVKDVQSIEGIK